MIQNRIDQKFYESPEDFPDYGGWFVVEMKNNTLSFAGGTSAELAKLPYGDTIPRGSTAICQDTGTTYVYSAETGTVSDWVALIEDGE